MNRRRELIIALGASALVAPRGSFAQQQGKVWRIGFLYFGSRQSALDTGRYSAFVQGIRELGYVEGKNVTVEARFGDGQVEHMSALAGELVRSKVDVIVATGTGAYRALQHATTTIPIVITVTNDPVVLGLAASLSRPGGNFTGLADTAADLGPKQIELLTIVVPKVARVGVLLNPANASHPTQLERLMLATQKVGMQVVLAEAGTVADVESAFISLAQYRADVVILFADNFFVQQLRQIAQAAIKQHVPSIYTIHEYVKVGGLMSYGADLVDNFRRAASYVDKIFKGANPSELPFEQPTKYSLAINIKTAKTLGLAIPQSMVLRADEVIQ